MYTEVLSCENVDEYYNAMDDDINNFMRRDTWDIVSSKSVSDQNMIPGTWYLKWKKKPDWTIRKFKVRYCMRGDVYKRLPPETLHFYSTVTQWTKVRLMLILQCIIGLQHQSIDLTGRYYKWVAILHLTSQVFQEWWGTMWCCYNVKEKPIWPRWSRTPLVWKVSKYVFRSRFFGNQGGSVPVHV